MKSKNSRLDSIKMIISSKEIGSQEELLQELAKEGFQLTQATLSRDLKQLKVAKAASMNGNYVYATNDNVEDEQYLIRSDLDERSTYEDKIQLSCTTWLWNFAILQEGKYPNFRGYVYDPELQKGIDLPTDPEITELNSELEDLEDSIDRLNKEV